MRLRQSRDLAIEAYGVRVALACDRAPLLHDARAVLPPTWRECGDEEADVRFSLSGDESSGYQVRADEALVAATGDREVALGVLDAKIRAEISSRATGWTFIHAGVVEHGTRALVLPGMSFSGKTTLVRALIEAGASYFSDEFAVLDADGRVHPYARPLSIRIDGVDAPPTELAAASFGASTGSEPAQIALVAVAPYRAGSHWQPRTYSASNAALALLSHAIVARERPDDVLDVVTRAAAEARLLEGERGEAVTTARALLRTLDYVTAG